MRLSTGALLSTLSYLAISPTQSHARRRSAALALLNFKAIPPVNVVVPAVQVDGHHLARHLLFPSASVSPGRRRLATVDVAGDRRRSGKQAADDRVEKSLYHRANGYSHPAVKIFMTRDGKTVEHHTLSITLQTPPA